MTGRAADIMNRCVDIFVLLSVQHFSVTFTFNVDTSSPLVFKGQAGSYFGYSVAILENSDGIWLV